MDRRVTASQSRAWELREAWQLAASSMEHQFGQRGLLQSSSALTLFAVGDGSFGIAIPSPIAGCVVLPFQNSTINLKFGFCTAQ